MLLGLLDRILLIEAQIHFYLVVLAYQEVSDTVQFEMTSGTLFYVPR